MTKNKICKKNFKAHLSRTRNSIFLSVQKPTIVDSSGNAAYVLSAVLSFSIFAVYREFGCEL